MEDANVKINIIESDDEIDEIWSLLLSQWFYIKKIYFLSTKKFINVSLF